MEVKRDKRARLTNDQVVALRNDYARLRDGLEPGEPVIEVEDYLADKYGVSTVTVGLIASGQSRKSAGGPLRPRPGYYRQIKDRGFTMATDLVVHDPSGRVHQTIRLPEGYTATLTPISIPIDNETDLEANHV